MKLTTASLLKSAPRTVRLTAGLPATAVLGERLARVGTGAGTRTVKAVALVAVPPGVVSTMRPDVAPLGTVNVRVVALTTVNEFTTAPLSVTVVVPAKSVPVTVTNVPTTPLAGVKLLIVGAGTTTANGTAPELPPPGAGVVTTTG